MDRGYARAPVGERARCTKPYHRGAQVNLIGAVDVSGIRTLMTVDDTVNGDVFVVFAERFLAPTLCSGDVVVWDNLSLHKMASIRSIIESTGAELWFLPPYSPDLNPIEEFWSKLKAEIRRFAPPTIGAFHRALRWAMSLVTRDDLRGWFKHSGYLAQCG